MLVFIGLILFTEIYTVIGIRSLASGQRYGYIYYILYVISLLIFIGFFVSVAMDFRSGVQLQRTAPKNLFNGFAFTIFITKLVFSLVLFFGDLGRLIYYLAHQIAPSFTSEEFSNGRRKFVAQTGMILAAVPFASLIYGITKGKYNYQIKRIKLAFDDLPKAFHGLRIVQISDIHSGSFDDKNEVTRGVEMINELKPDVVLFTGDLVNNTADEVAPFIDVFASIEAKMGKYSILGNHDYGDYWRWNSEDEKAQNLTKLFQYQKDMGFELMKNSNTRIEKDGEYIQLAGVENWGKPPFHQYGDLEKAFEGMSDNDFTILMSHDPSHWDEQVLSHKKHVHLTLSGHTHGMQFGIDIPGIKWSPVKYRYPRWSGLYKENNQHLYVNKGFGFLGFPGRVGMWPEITVFELERTA